MNTPPIRDWTFIVFKVEGHGLAPEVARSLQALDESDVPPSSAICVRAERDGYISDFQVDSQGRHRLHPMCSEARPSAQYPILSGEAINDFLKTAVERYPARHYFVSFEGHSEQLRKAIRPMHEALRSMPGKVDVLAFDSCFLAQAETASEFHDVAKVLLASQEAVGGTRPVEEAAKHSELGPEAMAGWFVANHDDLTFSALDLSRTPSLERSLRHLSGELRNLHDEVFEDAVRKTVRGAQHFYTEGIDAPHPYHNTVDLYDAVSSIARLCQGDHHGKLRRACEHVLRELDGMVLAEHHVETTQTTPYLDYTRVRNPHGLSIHWPTTPSGLRDEYTRFAYGALERKTGFHRAVDHLTSSRNPTYLAASTVDYVAGKALSTLGNALERSGA